jgi:predicted nucleic acid-binding protein
MPTDLLVNVKDGTDVFVDANIFIYAFTGVSLECKAFLERCARQDVFGVSNFEIINEVTHRLMIHEAYQKGLISKPRAKDLQQRSDLVKGLSDYWTQVSQIFPMNLVLVAAEEAILRQAHVVRITSGLLTLDSVLVATMEHYGIQRLASHDGDFDPIATITRFHPTDIP